jgi:hypothetical protein
MLRSPGCGCKPPDDPKRRRWHVRIDDGYKRVGQKRLKGAKIDADLDVHWVCMPKTSSKTPELNGLRWLVLEKFSFQLHSLRHHP